MKTRLNSQSVRQGFTYVSVVIAAVLIGLILATYLKLVASQNQMTMRSQAWNRNIAVVEAGIEEAMAHLNKNAVWDISTGTYTVNLLSDGWAAASGGGWTKTANIGDDYYVVNISQFAPAANCPNIVAEGYVKQLPTFAMRRWASRPFLAVLGRDESATYVKRTVTCGTTNLPVFSKALVATRTIDLNGNGVLADSYDSTDPAKSTNGRWVAAKRGARGDIATNNSLTNSIDIGNADIYGSIATGPNPLNPGHANAKIGSQGKVGDLSWFAGTANKGIQPGKDRDDMNVFFPDITPPFTSGLGPVFNYTWTNGVKYTRFGSADYVVSGFSGKTLIVGNARILVTGSFKLTGNEEIRIAPGASLIMFMDGPSADWGGNGVINGTGKATGFYYFGTKNNTSIRFSGNGEFTGAVYAPNADVDGNGGGNSAEDFMGAAIIKSLKFNGHYSFHYDEALGRNGMFTGFTLTSWNEL
ncbi:MAG TPA: hypothetical protein VK530_08980 [Candidatus Acidoferrum sp.]|nr:hypothetical protein [Candidatus Acidoferrum sp.]